MIKEFKLFENLLVDDVVINVKNVDDNFINMIKNDLAFIVYKVKKKYTHIRASKIDGDFSELNGDVIKAHLTIKMTNKDVIDAVLIENKSIDIEINGNLVYSIDNDNFDLEAFKNKLVKVYKEHLTELKYKIER